MSYSWMPLYIADYLADTGHLRAAESGAYLHLIMHYWQRGGLPDDDRQLATIAKMADEEWSGARPTIELLFLPGWKHKRIDAELARATEKYERRAAAGRLGVQARAAKQQSSSNAQAGHDHVSVVVSKEEPSEVESNEERKDSGIRAREAPKNDWPADAWDLFWSPYPHKVGKHAARKAFDRIRKSATGPPWAAFMAGLGRYVAKTDDRPWCNPATWLNEGRWEDQPANPGLFGNGQHRNGNAAGDNFGFGGLHAHLRARSSGHSV